MVFVQMYVRTFHCNIATNVPCTLHMLNTVQLYNKYLDSHCFPSMLRFTRRMSMTVTVSFIPSRRFSGTWEKNWNWFLAILFQRVTLESELLATSSTLYCGSTCVLAHSRCGIRGGYLEVVGLDPEVRAVLEKYFSAKLCSSTPGQVRPILNYLCIHVHVCTVKPL